MLLAGNVFGGSYPVYAQDTQYHDGNYTASAHVEFHEAVVNYDLYVTVSVKDGVISKVALNDAKNADIEAVNVPYVNYAMKAMAQSYIGTTGTAADTVSGATYSANAINEAVAKAMVKSHTNEADENMADTLPVTTDKMITRMAVTTQMIQQIPAIQETAVINAC